VLVLLMLYGRLKGFHMKRRRSWSEPMHWVWVWSGDQTWSSNCMKMQTFQNEKEMGRRINRKKIRLIYHRFFKSFCRVYTYRWYCFWKEKWWY
jgi:hypothetical protein